MRVDDLPSPGIGKKGHLLRQLMSNAISQIEISAMGYPGGKHPAATSFSSFLAACSAGALAVGSGTTPPTLTSAKRVLIIGDSLSAGRGAGTTDGAIGMAGARALSFPTKLRDGLIASGINATSESFIGEANNTGSTLPAYDPRVTLGTWAAAGGVGIGGKLLSKTGAAAAGALTFTPTIPVDTFEVFLPRVSYGDVSISVDGGPAQIVSETGTAALLKIVVSVAKGTHTIAIDRSNAATVFLVGITGYDSTTPDIRILNAGSRAYSTTDWVIADQPWRPLTGIDSYAPDLSIINLGVNDFRANGPLNSIATYKTNMQTIINRAKTFGAVMLMIPTAAAITEEGSFTQAQLKTAIQELAASNGNLPIYDAYAALGTWEAGNAAGQTFDTLHWKAPAYATIGAGLVAPVRAVFGL